MDAFEELTKYVPKAINLPSLLRAEHQLIDNAFNEWVLALDDGKMGDAVCYLNGVHDMADRLVQLLDPQEKEETKDE